MEIYICGISEVDTYERISRRETRCYVCFDDLYYAIRLYDTNYHQETFNSLLAEGFSDTDIVDRIYKARDTGELSKLESGVIIDLDSTKEKRNSTPIVPNKRQLVRYCGKLYMIMYCRYYHIVQNQSITHNHYDDEEVLKRLKDLLIDKGYLPNIECCDISMTEINLLFKELKYED